MPSTISRSMFFSFTCFSLGFLFSSQLFAGSSEDRQEIIAGVSEIAAPGVVGSLSVYGPDAFAIATAKTKNGQPAPVIAAAQLKKGRIVVFGHNGYLSPATMKEGQTGKLVSNLIRWSAGLEKIQTAKLRIGIHNNRPLVQSFQQAGLVAKELTGNWTANLRGMNVVICDPRGLQERDVSKLVEFVESGNGLLMGTGGWVWEGYTAKQGETLVNDFLGNHITLKAGIVWDSPTVVTPASKRFSVSKTLPEGVHAQRALTLLKNGESGDAALLSVATISRTVQSIRNDDQLFFPELQSMLEQELGQVVIPSFRKKVRSKNALARLQVALNTRLAIGQAINELTASPLAEEFPKQPPARAQSTEKTLSINTKISRWHSTGLFARAGDVVTVTVPKNATSAGLSVRVGCHKDKLWHKDDWSRAPEITREFSITTAETQVGNAFGGLVYIVVPNDCKLGEIDAQISGAIASPLFVFGETSVAQWRRIRNLPGPWAELASDRFIITLPSESIRKLNRPDEVMVYWNQVLDTCADLAMISTERKYPERFVIDVQISAGYMHAGYPIMAPLNLALESTDLETLKSKGNWGMFHEIGHNHQQREWTWDGLGEVTVNLFSMYVYDTLIPGAVQHGKVQPSEIAKMTREFQQNGKLAGAWPQLIPYYELKQNFGWQPFKTVFAEYQEIPANQKPKTLQEKKDLWLVMFSQAVGKDLSPFYEFWNFGASQAAKQKVSDLPAWSPKR